MPHKHTLQISGVNHRAIWFTCTVCSYGTQRSKVWIYERLQGVPIKKAKRPRYR